MKMNLVGTLDNERIKKLKKEYLKRKGVRCLICGGDSTISSYADTDRNYCTFDVECEECGSTWQDVYILQDAKNITVGKEK
jgi:hypothetical protein